MNILMIEVPTAERDGAVPFGVLYAASSAYRKGHKVKILDLVKEDLCYADIKKIIEDHSAGLIGLGGITSSYKKCKELALNIKADFKDIPIVAGGVLSSIPDLLLRKAGIDFVIHGEGEISFPNLIEAIEKRKDISTVNGVSYLEGGAIRKTVDQPQIRDLDDILIPEYSLLDMDRYIEPMEDWVDHYFRYEKDERKKKREELASKKLFPIITARGCTHRCIFCYRHNKGLRQHSVEYVVGMIKYLRDSYDIDVFQINDELTTADKSWVLKFCDTIINEKVGIYFIIISSRVDTVDEKMLKRLKEAGCLMINYGYESGSDLILKEIRKGATREEALKAGLLTKEAGLKNAPEMIIGFPSESNETVSETIDFLKQFDTLAISINTPMPFPETPLWERAVEKGLIKDREEFILGYKRGLFVNFTRYSDKKALSLVSRVRCDVRLHWLKKRKRYVSYARCYIEKVFTVYLRLILPVPIYDFIRKPYRIFFKD